MKKVKTIGIVSLSSGILGEHFVQHEVKIGLERLEKLGIQVKFMGHACKGLKYISEHPEDRARDLLSAFQDDSIDMILCTIGGEFYSLTGACIVSDCGGIFTGFCRAIA